MLKSSKIARGGLYTALTFVILYVCSVVPTNRLTLLVLSSAIIPLSIITIGVKYSFIVYLSSGLLSLILGAKAPAIGYILLFGLYGFVKYYIEALRKVHLEIFLKLIFFSMSAAIIYYIYNLLAFYPDTKISFNLLAILYLVFAAIYDYALTLIINYINKKFKDRF